MYQFILPNDLGILFLAIMCIAPMDQAKLLLDVNFEKLF